MYLSSSVRLCVYVCLYKSLSVVIVLCFIIAVYLRNTTLFGCWLLLMRVMMNKQSAGNEYVNVCICVCVYVCVCVCVCAIEPLVRVVASSLCFHFHWPTINDIFIVLNHFNS